MLTVGSMFTGIGGFDLGAEQAGCKVLWQIENDKSCQEVLRYRFPDAQLHDDVTQIDFKQLPKVDVLTAGFPCQGNSIAGKRRGLEDDRSGLFYEVVRYLEECQPE